MTICIHAKAKGKLSKRAQRRIKGTSLAGLGKPSGSDKRIRVKHGHGLCLTYTPEQIAEYLATNP